MSAVVTVSLVSGAAKALQTTDSSRGLFWFWKFGWCNRLSRQRIQSTKLFVYAERWNHMGPKSRTRIKPAAEWAPQDPCKAVSISHIQSVNISVCEPDSSFQNTSWLVITLMILVFISRRRRRRGSLHDPTHTDTWIHNMNQRATYSLNIHVH